MRSNDAFVAHCRRSLVLLAASLTLVATLRLSPVTLVVLVGNADSATEREAHQIALKSLCSAAQVGDSIRITAAGEDVELPSLAPFSGNFLQMRRLPQRDVNIAIEDAARRLTASAFSSRSTLCVVVASPSAGAIRAEAVALLPPGTHVRLIGAKADANLAAFNAASASPLDLSETEPAQLPQATAEMIRQMQGMRTLIPTGGTAILSSVYLMCAMGLLVRRQYLRRRKVHLLWETDGRDETVALLEGQQVSVAGRTLRRENGRIVLSDPQKSDSPRDWKQPGDTLEITSTDGATVFVHIV